MKTMAVDIECVHALVFFLKVPDHWTRDDAIQALGYPVIAGLAEKADKSEWGCTVEGMNLRLGAVYDWHDNVNIDYAFQDEPPPLAPGQVALFD